VSIAELKISNTTSKGKINFNQALNGTFASVKEASNKPVGEINCTK